MAILREGTGTCFQLGKDAWLLCTPNYVYPIKPLEKEEEKKPKSQVDMARRKSSPINKKKLFDS